MTLALYGKSRRRQWMLAALALIGIAGALSAAFGLRQSASAIVPGNVPLNPAHVGAQNSTFPDAGTETCPTPPAGQAGWWGWHFLMPANNNFTSLSVTFQSAGTFSASPFPGSVFVATPDASHAYIWTPTDDILTAGSATSSGSNSFFNLSHTCPGTEPPETVTPTSTPTPVTATPTNTPVTATPTNTPVTATPTNTPVTATPTNTPVTPTPTNTPVTPTSTPQVPTPTPEIPTPTPEIPTPVPTATPEPPTAVPTQAPTNVEPEPTETSAEAGERIPGPTPIAPSTGAGNGAAGGGLNLLLIVAGLAALGSGLTLTVAGNRRRG